MAEATERPANEKGASASVPPAPPLGEGDAPKVYGSISLVAVGGLALAGLYAAVVLLGGLIALLNHTPWILPLWTLVFPLAAVAVCLAARVQIANSEGALTGRRLTTWGLGLGLGVGLVYAAYYAGSYWALTSQAQTFTDQWLEFVQKDQLDQAFRMTLKPDLRPAADARDLRDRLEIEFDHARGAEGEFTQFRQSPLVRQFEQGAADNHVQFLGVHSWGAEGNGYKVELTYHVITRGNTNDIVFVVVGSDSADDTGARQWNISYKETRPLNDPVMTDEGRRMAAQSRDARRFAQSWIDEVKAWQWDKAYLGTLPPAERAAQDKERGEAFKTGLAAFRAGGLVRADPGKFWAPPGQRDARIADVKGLFGRGGENPDDVSLAGTVPVFGRDGDRVTCRLDVTIVIPSLGQMFHGQLVIASDAPNGDPQAGDWRVEALELINAKSMPIGTPQSGPGPNRPPG